MKYQKKLIVLALFCFCFLAFESFAQGRKGLRGPFKLIEANKVDLQITNEQEEQLSALKEEMRAFQKEARAQAKADETTDRSAMRQQMKEKIDQELALILTEKQMADLTSLQAERKEQWKAKRAERLEKKAAFREERKAYFEQNQLPVLQAQRAKLESEITAEDKATIERLRIVVETQKAKYRETRKALKDDLRTGEGKKTFSGKGPARKGKNKLHRMFANEADLNTTLALVEQYNEPIEALFAEISEEEKQWKADHKAARQAHAAENGKVGQRGDKKRKGKRKGQNQTDRKAQKNLQKKVKFLLMDPNAAFISKSLTTANHQLKAYPNPARNQQTIEFELEQAGRVNVELLNKEGKVVQSIFEGQLPAGKQQMDVRLETLDGYVFYYRITDQQGTSSLKILLNQE